MHDDARTPDAESHPRSVEFMELYTRFHRQLYVYIATLVPNPTDAQDLLQEASLTLWQKFADYEPGTSFLAWSRTVARYRVLQHLESTKRNVGLLPPEVLEVLAMHEAANPSEAAEAAHFEMLQECIESLRSADRELLHLRYFRKLPVQEMAAQHHRSPNAISQSLARIRGALYTCIRMKQRAGGTSHA